MERNEINPNMLILARQARALTQRELSTKLSIEQGRLSKLEHGLIQVNEDLLNELTKILQFPKEFFSQSGQIYPSELSLFRKRQSLSKRTTDQIIAQLHLQYYHLLKLYQSIEVETFLQHFDLDEYESPKKVAIALRKLWQLPSGRIDNLTGLLEKAGVIILHLDINTDKFDGVKFIADNKIPIIALNKNKPPDRMRMTLGEEWAHILMHKINTPTADDEALEFASEFLVPSNEIEFPSHITLSDLADLKRYWKVSMGSLLYKAKTTKKITQWQYQSLWSEISKLGYKKREPVELDPPFEKPELVEKIFTIFMNDFKYSLEDFLNLFCIYNSDFNNWWSPYLKEPKNKHSLKLIRGGAFYN